MDQTRLFERLDRRRQDFLASFTGLPDDVLLTPGVTGEWSVRDLITHVITWEEEALKALPLVLNGKPLPRYASVGGIDAFDEREQERKGDMSLDQVKRHLERTHRRLVAWLEGVSTDAYASEGRFLKRLRLDSYGHYREHTTQILSWRKLRGL